LRRGRGRTFPAVPLTLLSFRHMLFSGREKIHPPLFNNLLLKDMAISRMKAVLRERLQKETSFCGTLVQFQEQGILITGESRSGKSSCALKLVLLGGRMISDDIVVIRKMPKGALIGRSPERTKNLMAIRSLGIVNVRHLLGDAAVMEESPIGMVVSLAARGKKQGRVSSDVMRILGVRLPLFGLEHGASREAADAIRNCLSIIRERPSPFQRKKGAS
jgi:HPr kinase/phosphorylase